MPPKDCSKPDEPEHPKTHCEHHRDSVQTSSPEGSTGHCWCVDNRGQERAGTRTPAGTPRKDCDAPGELSLLSLGRAGMSCGVVYRVSLRDHRRTAALVLIRNTRTHHPVGPSLATREGGGGGGEPGHKAVGMLKGTADGNASVERNDPTISPLHGGVLRCVAGHCVRDAELARRRRDFEEHQSSEVQPPSRPKTTCERWRASLVEQHGDKPEPHHYLPQWSH
ncbi:hypothetical protein CRUP_011105 [Coryphaenoides rupestris]|nr:hypothetical protein CRUP_011105 [Coryphaenoides rupestris]